MKQSGFTLLEVLVATVIMAVAIGGTLSALSSSMRNEARLSDYDRAAMFARRKLDELLVDRKLPKMAPLEGVWDPADDERPYVGVAGTNHALGDDAERRTWLAGPRAD